jgi:hypothetical protein
MKAATLKQIHDVFERLTDMYVDLIPYEVNTTLEINETYGYKPYDVYFKVVGEHNEQYLQVLCNCLKLREYNARYTDNLIYIVVRITEAI